MSRSWISHRIIWVWISLASKCNIFVTLGLDFNRVDRSQNGTCNAELSTIKPESSESIQSKITEPACAEFSVTQDSRTVFFCYLKLLGSSVHDFTYIQAYLILWNSVNLTHFYSHGILLNCGILTLLHCTLSFLLSSLFSVISLFSNLLSKL